MNDRQYQHKLDKLLLTTKLNTAEILVNAKNVSYVLSDETSCVVEVAKCLERDFLRYCEQLPQKSLHQ